MRFAKAVRAFLRDVPKAVALDCTGPDESGVDAVWEHPGMRIARRPALTGCSPRMLPPGRLRRRREVVRVLPWSAIVQGGV